MAVMLDDFGRPLLPPAAPAPAPAPVPAQGLFDDLVPAPAPALAPDAIATGPLPDPAPAPVPVPDQTGLGAFADLVPFADQSVTAAPVSLAERFMLNAQAAHGDSALGAAANYGAVKLAPDTMPIDPNTGQPLPGLTPRQQVQQSVIEQHERLAQLPPWQDTPGFFGKAAAGGAALAGSLAGAFASPEALIAGPDAYEAVRLGGGIIPNVLKAGGVQALVQGGANAAAQGTNIAAGTRDEFSLEEAGKAAAMGAVIGSAHPVVAGVVNRFRGIKPSIQIRGTDGSLRTVEDQGEWGGQPVFEVEQPTAAAAARAQGMFDDLVPAPRTRVEPPPPAMPEPAAAQVDINSPINSAPHVADVNSGRPAEPQPGENLAPPGPGTPGPTDLAAPQPGTPDPSRPGTPGTAGTAIEPPASPVPAPTGDTGVAPTPAPAPAEVPTYSTAAMLAHQDPVKLQLAIEQAGGKKGAVWDDLKDVEKTQVIQYLTNNSSGEGGGGPQGEGGPRVPGHVPGGEASATEGKPVPSEPPAAVALAARDPNRETVTTPTGRKVDTQFEVVPADSLIHATGDLQPRDRAGRLPSDDQIRDIAAKLDPALLHSSPGPDQGAPIVGKDNIIDSGNGRVAAIKQVYAAGDARAADYRAMIESRGFDTTGITDPVLIRRRLTDFTPEDRRAFAVEGSMPTAARFSATEQAAIDAHGLTHELLAKYDPSLKGGVLAAGNDNFARAWVDTLPQSERNAVQAEDGRLSAEGVRRINGAMLGRAYGDKGTLARHLESTDDDTKSLTGALTDAAPAWARLRAATERNAIPKEFDTAPQLMQAADLVRQAREKGQSMNDIVNQRDVFSGSLDPVVEQYVRAFYNPAGTRAASRPAIADVLRRYADEAQRQARSGGLFGDGEKITPEDTLRSIVSRRDGTAGPTQSSMLGNGTKLAADDRPVSLDDAPLHDAGTGTAPAPAPVTTPDTAGPTRSPLGGVRPGRDFNEGTSPYRQVFRDAGHDPDLMVNRPLPEQNRVIATHVKSTFGFKDVRIDPRQTPKEVRDQLSNFYQNAREMANVLGMPYGGISLHGRVTLATKPYWQPRQALGKYFPGERVIEIPGRSNSFAHEWTHALDHYLSDALGKNPKAMRLLSATKGITEGKVGGRKFGPDTPAEAFAGVLRALYGKDAETAAEALRLQYEIRTLKDPAALATAKARLAQIETEFSRNARAQKGNYYSSPVEMLARAHETYVSEMMQRQGGDTRAIVKPYYDAPPGEGGRMGQIIRTLYPQQAERDTIFQAFTDLHDRLRAESILGTGVGARPDGLDIVDMRHWDKMADPKQDPGLWATLRREAQAQRNWRAQAWHRMGFDPTAAKPGNLSIGTRIADAGRAATYSVRGIGEAIIARQPSKRAKAAYQQIMDRLAPAEGIRSAEAASGRYIGPVFEQAVREQARVNINRLGNILEAHKLNWFDLAKSGKSAEDVATEKMMLRHVLTEGDAKFVPSGGTKAVPIPENIQKAAGQIRKLLDDEWERNNAAGIDVGYAKSGFFPRLYDDHKIYGDREGFKTAASELHRLIFEKDVGKDPNNLLAAHDRLAPDIRAQLPRDVQDGVAALRQNLKEQDKLEGRIADGTSKDPAGDRARLAQLQTEAEKLHTDIHDPIRDLYGKTAAEAWFNRINDGDPTDFDTRGPNASYTTARKLPPEADRIMRDYMVSDPSEALTRYFQQSARKVAFNDRFGKNGSKLDALIHEATLGGARGEDNESIRHLVEVVTGKQKSGLPSQIEKTINFIHAAGTVALMPRAMWSSLAEPVAVLARTGHTKAMFQAFAHQIGDIVGTADSKQRAELANALGLTTSHLYDSIINDRTDAHYRDAPGLSRMLANYYARTGLTALTNSQRRSVMSAGHTALDAWAKDLLGSNTRLTRDAAAQFRDLGIADKDQAAFAKWITERKGLPNLADLDTAGGRMWGHAVSRLTDQIIQDPMRVDKPLMSQNPVGRLAYGLMSFNYSFYHNIIERTLSTHAARIKEGYTDVRDAGGGRLKALAGTAAPIARAGVHISASAAAVYAASLATTTLREAIFSGEKWKEHEDTGDLGEWLSDLAIQRTGVNGPLDPIAQAITGLKYERDLSGLLAGAQVGYFLQAAGDMLKPVAGFGSPNTNTSEYNAWKAAWNMFGVPAAGVALTALPGGPLMSKVYGATLQYVTGRDTADAIATGLVGPKGTGPDGKPPPARKPPDPNAEPTGSGSGLLGGVPLGFADDLAAPAAKVALPLWQRLPRVGQIGTAVGAGVAGASALADEFSKWKEK